MLKTIAAFAVASFAFMPLAHAAGDMHGPVKMMKTKAGDILTDSKGMTLYTFDMDKKDKSACTGKCAVAWPPMMAAKSAKATGDFSIIKRPGGARQWAYKGQPLYAWKNDKKPGDMTGDGFKGVWHTAMK